VLVDAITGAANKLVIVSADTDHVPMFKHVRTLCENVQIVLRVPPGRFERTRSLRTLSHDADEITEQRLWGCLLPRDVYDAKHKKIATCPADYLP
jgi:hypothetical protein